MATSLSSHGTTRPLSSEGNSDQPDDFEEQRDMSMAYPYGVEDGHELKYASHRWKHAWDELILPDGPHRILRSIVPEPSPAVSSSNLVSILVDLPRKNICLKSALKSRQHIEALICSIKAPHKLVLYNEFRLLTLHQRTDWDSPIRGKLENLPLPQSPEDGAPFTALSYCWGSYLRYKKVIFIDGQLFVIGEDLFAALVYLKTSDSQPQWVGWIDAICINQNDLQEKSLQIPLMGQIFAAAAHCVIWLGYEYDDCGYVLDVIETNQVDRQTESRFIHGLGQLLHRPWFTRVWVIQELALTVSPVLTINSKSTTWSKFMRTLQSVVRGQVSRQLQEKAISIGKPTEANMSAARLLLHIADWKSLKYVTTLAITRKRSKKTGLDLPRILRLTTKSIASNPKDKVYGLLGLTTLHHHANFVVDYTKSIAQVYQDVTSQLLLEYPALETYMYVLFPPRRAIPGAPYCPSWVLNFEPSFTRYPAIRYIAPQSNLDKDNSQRAHTLRIKEGILEMKATIVDEIIEVVDFPTCCRGFREHSRLVDTHSLRRNIGDDVLRTLEPTLSALGKRWPVPDEESLPIIAEYLNFMRACNSLHKEAVRLSKEWRPAGIEPVWKTMAGFDRSINDAVNVEDMFAVLTGEAEPPSNHWPNCPDDDRRRITWSSLLARDVADALGSDPDSDASGVFITKHGLCGLCMPGAEPGDVASVLFRGSCCEIGFILRPAERSNQYRMVSASYIPDIWKEFCKMNNRLEPMMIEVV